MTSLSPGPLFSTSGLNQPSLPVSRTTSKGELQNKYSRQSKSLDSPQAEVYDIGNTPTKMVLLNEQCRPTSGSHLRGQAVPRPPKTPNPKRHQSVTTRKKNQERHVECNDSTSPRFKRRSMVAPIYTTHPLRPLKKAPEPSQRHNSPSARDSSPQNRRNHSPKRKRQPSAPLQTISVEDNSYLLHPDLSRGNQLYLWHISRLYDQGQMRKLKQRQYEELLMLQAFRGFNSYSEYQRYMRHLNTPRKQQFSNDMQPKRPTTAPIIVQIRDKSKKQKKAPKHTEDEINDDNDKKKEEEDTEAYQDADVRQKSPRDRREKKKGRDDGKTKSGKHRSKKQKSALDEEEAETKQPADSAEESTAQTPRQSYPRPVKLQPLPQITPSSKTPDQTGETQQGEADKHRTLEETEELPEEKTMEESDDKESSRKSEKDGLKEVSIHEASHLKEKTDRKNSFDGTMVVSDIGNDGDKDNEQEEAPSTNEPIKSIHPQTTDTEKPLEDQVEKSPGQTVPSSEPKILLTTDSQNRGLESDDELTLNASFSSREGTIRPKSRLGNRPTPAEREEISSQEGIKQEEECKEVPNVEGVVETVVSADESNLKTAASVKERHDLSTGKSTPEERVVSEELDHKSKDEQVEKVKPSVTTTEVVVPNESGPSEENIQQSDTASKDIEATPDEGHAEVQLPISEQESQTTTTDRAFSPQDEANGNIPPQSSISPDVINGNVTTTEELSSVGEVKKDAPLQENLERDSQKPDPSQATKLESSVVSSPAAQKDRPEVEEAKTIQSSATINNGSARMSGLSDIDENTVAGIQGQSEISLKNEILTEDKDHPAAVKPEVQTDPKAKDPSQVQSAEVNFDNEQSTLALARHVEESRELTTEGKYDKTVGVDSVDKTGSKLGGSELGEQSAGGLLAVNNIEGDAVPGTSDALNKENKNIVTEIPVESKEDKENKAISNISLSEEGKRVDRQLEVELLAKDERESNNIISAKGAQEIKEALTGGDADSLTTAKDENASTEMGNSFVKESLDMKLSEKISDSAENVKNVEAKDDKSADGTVDGASLTVDDRNVRISKASKEDDLETKPEKGIAVESNIPNETTDIIEEQGKHFNTVKDPIVENSIQTAEGGNGDSIESSSNRVKIDSKPEQVGTQDTADAKNTKDSEISQEPVAKAEIGGAAVGVDVLPLETESATVAGNLSAENTNETMVASELKTTDLAVQNTRMTDEAGASCPERGTLPDVTPSDPPAVAETGQDGNTVNVNVHDAVASNDPVSVKDKREDFGTLNDVTSHRAVEKDAQIDVQTNKEKQTLQTTSTDGDIHLAIDAGNVKSIEITKDATDTAKLDPATCSGDNEIKTAVRAADLVNVDRDLKINQSELAAKNTESTTAVNDEGAFSATLTSAEAPKKQDSKNLPPIVESGTTEVSTSNEANLVQTSTEIQHTDAAKTEDKVANVTQVVIPETLQTNSVDGDVLPSIDAESVKSQGIIADAAAKAVEEAGAGIGSNEIKITSTNEDLNKFNNDLGQIKSEISSENAKSSASEVKDEVAISSTVTGIDREDAAKLLDVDTVQARTESPTADVSLNGNTIMQTDAAKAEDKGADTIEAVVSEAPDETSLIDGDVHLAINAKSVKQEGNIESATTDLVKDSEVGIVEIEKKVNSTNKDLVKDNKDIASGKFETAATVVINETNNSATVTQVGREDTPKVLDTDTVTSNATIDSPENDDARILQTSVEDQHIDTTKAEDNVADNAQVVVSEAPQNTSLGDNVHLAVSAGNVKSNEIIEDATVEAVKDPRPGIENNTIIITPTNKDVIKDKKDIEKIQSEIAPENLTTATEDETTNSVERADTTKVLDHDAAATNATINLSENDDARIPQASIEIQRTETTTSEEKTAITSQAAVTETSKNALIGGHQAVDAGNDKSEGIMEDAIVKASKDPGAGIGDNDIKITSSAVGLVEGNKDLGKIQSEIASGNVEFAASPVKDENAISATVTGVERVDAHYVPASATIEASRSDDAAIAEAPIKLQLSDAAKTEDKITNASQADVSEANSSSPSEKNITTDISSGQHKVLNKTTEEVDTVRVEEEKLGNTASKDITGKLGYDKELKSDDAKVEIQIPIATESAGDIASKVNRGNEATSDIAVAGGELAVSNNVGSGSVPGASDNDNIVMSEDPGRADHAAAENKEANAILPAPQTMSVDHEGKGSATGAVATVNVEQASLEHKDVVPTPVSDATGDAVIEVHDRKDADVNKVSGASSSNPDAVSVNQDVNTVSETEPAAGAEIEVSNTAKNTAVSSVPGIAASENNTTSENKDVYAEAASKADTVHPENKDDAAVDTSETAKVKTPVATDESASADIAVSANNDATSASESALNVPPSEEKEGSISRDDTATREISSSAEDPQSELREESQIVQKPVESKGEPSTDSTLAGDHTKENSPISENEENPEFAEETPVEEDRAVESREEITPGDIVFIVKNAESVSEGINSLGNVIISPRTGGDTPSTLQQEVSQETLKMIPSHLEEKQTGSAQAADTVHDRVLMANETKPDAADQPGSQNNFSPPAMEPENKQVAEHLSTQYESQINSSRKNNTSPVPSDDSF